MATQSKAVLITGCSTGIGRATAEHLAAKGWTVYATARKPESIQELARRGCRTLALDVCDESSMRRAVETGFTLADLDDWFLARAGQPLSPAGRCFVLGPQLPPPFARHYLVILAETPELVDGFMQWQATAGLIDRRLGPTAFVVDEANLGRFKEVLGELGIGLVSQIMV